MGGGETQQVVGKNTTGSGEITTSGQIASKVNLQITTTGSEGTSRKKDSEEEVTGSGESTSLRALGGVVIVSKLAETQAV